MAEKPTPYERLRHQQLQQEKVARAQKCHMARQVCQDSNWPFTGDLSPEQIACMTDSYFGRRRSESCIPARCAYDSLFHRNTGWNQWARMDTRENFRECQYSANLEDKQRTVPVCGNSAYGHYLDRFIDFTYKDHAHVSTCKEFYQNGPISTLPSVKDLDQKHPCDS
ncbi:hypothetical protein BsWGS_22182 [Bradybaena similaris]